MKDGEIVQHGKPEDIVLNPENDYVRDFVAHTNPLNVLRATSIMRELRSLWDQSNGYCLNKKSDIWLDNDHKHVRYNGQSIPVHMWQEGDRVEQLRSVPVCVSAEMPIRDVMEIRYYTGYPVLIKENNEVNGVIGDRELYHTLLGKMLSDDD